MKTTSNGRRPQNIKSGISQQPLIGSYSYFKLNLDYQTILYKSFKWRGPPMEDDLKTLKVVYLSNLVLNHTQILNLSLDVQSIYFKHCKNEDNLHWKKTCNVRWPKNIRIGMSEKPLIGSYSNFKLKIRWPNYNIQIL